MPTQQHQTEIDRYVASTPKSREALAEAAKYLPGGSTRGAQYFPPYPFIAERARACTCTTSTATATWTL